ncbi:hypothetical protein Tco_0749761 [Tanacetum coccineum]|uniref:Uncharacterized protein n=1 Tax=Tanacetum coccineum TaxID=301880 RepID=A0ABQ4YZK8_9ASTR
MDLETSQINATAKLPILKQGEHEMWRLRIEQFFQIQDYALWDVIENVNSFKPEVRTTANADGTSTSTIPGPITTKEKVQNKNDVKARSMLLMALPNEHLLTFNQYKDAKTLFEAIQTRFGGNDATKKTQKTLLKQMYENFNALSTESLDSIFNRLQKIINLDLMSFDDLYNNFKIVEQEVKRTTSSDSSSNSQNMAFVSSFSSTNKLKTGYVHVSTASSSVSTDSTQNSTASLSDATVYAFLANQPNGSQLVHKDLEQIHEDDLEKMDLKWQLALLSMRARNSKKTVNVEETTPKAMIAIDGVGFDWSFMAEEEVTTNMALMDFSDSQVLNDKTCFNTCLKSFETLKTQLDNLRVEHNKFEFNLATYKRGLASVEEQLVFYKKNVVMFTDQIAILKRDASYNDSDIISLKSQIENLKKETESNQIKIDNFENASKSLDKLIGSQISNNSRKEFQQPEFEGYGVKVNKSVCENSSNEIKKTPDAPIIKEWVSDSDEDESEVIVSDYV